MSFLKNWKTIATAIQIGQKFFGSGSVDELSVETLAAINTWYLAEPQVKDMPFPDLGTGDRVLNDSFQIPDDGWGRVWNQRVFWIHHTATGKNTRWIDGRTAPQDVA